MLKFLTPALLLAFAPASAFAQAPGDVKINQVILYGDDVCPPDTPEMANICVTAPDPYRIPAPLRGYNPNDPERNSWANQAAQIERLGRTGIGSCSTAGIGGATGCFNELVRQARAERAQGDGTNWMALVEAARAGRMSKIDGEAAAIEAELMAEEAPK